MPRNSSTIIYLAIALGLLCYLTFIDKKRAGTKEQEAAETRLFNLEDPGDVTRMEINNVHGLFIFQKTNGHWEMIKPVDTPADNATVEGIVSQVSLAQPQRVIPISGTEDDNNNLKKWGLTSPAERVVIHTKDKKYELLVGRKTAISDSVYVRASGKKEEAVRVVPNTVKEALQKDLSDFRSKNVFDFDAEKVVKVATKIADPSTTLSQQCEVDLKDGKWTMQLPSVARASTPDMQTLIAKILAVHVVDFINDDASNLSQYGLTSPSATISVTIKPEGGKGDEDVVLQIGGPVPKKPDQVYAQRLKSNSVFTLTRTSVDELLKGLPAVRDRHVLPFDPAKVTQISYSIGTKKTDLRLKDTLWSIVGEGDARADGNQINDLLTKLSQLETTPDLKDSATDLKPFGLDKPVGKITLQSPEFKPGPSITLLIGKTVNKVVYVRNSTEPFIYTLPENALNFLPANNLVLRDARAINLDIKAVKSMTITVGNSTPITLNRSQGGTWSAANVKDRMVDSLKADTQVSLFSQLQAKAWLGPVLPAYGLSKPILTIAIQTDKAKPTVLHIGAALPDGSHAAQLEGEPAVFEIADGDYGILNASSIQLIPAEAAGTNAAPVAPSPATNAAPAKKK